MDQPGFDPEAGQPTAVAQPDGSAFGSPAVVTAEATSSPPGAVRPFIAQLARAMQATAEHQHEASNAEIHAITSAHLERVRARAVAEAGELRRMAREDVDAINAWQAAEAERIRAEAARRIVARDEELDGTLVRHAALIEGEVAQIEGVVANYQLQLDDYFHRITTEPNPSVIARLADQLPEPPDLAKVGGDARAKALTAMAEEGDATASQGPAPDAAPPDATTAEQPEPELVPVMGLAATDTGSASDDANAVGEATMGAHDWNKTNGSNGDGGEHGNPAMRLLRTITARAALATDRPAGGTAVEAPDETPAEPSGGEGDTERAPEVFETRSE